MTKSFIFKSIVGVLILVVTEQAGAQLTVSSSAPYNSPTYLVNNVLLGSGVQVSGVSFNGNPTQIGYFDATSAILPIPSGIIMASGGITAAVGPNNNGGQTIPAGGFNGPGDPDLDMMISPYSSYDAAVLEFDFVAVGDSVHFTYSFASEEYLEFVNSGFNDAFGFFLSGPGIAGPYSNGAVNIALIPNTSTPVTIDNVNNLVNSAYYIDNGDGYTAPYNTNAQYIQYDGMTVALEASYPVQCGQTYHIKLAVADAGDAILDSGVFLEYNSFSATMFSIVANASYSTVGNDTVLYEGCGQVELLFIRNNTNDTDTVFLDINGTATNGVDYPTIPDSIIFLPGQDTISVFVTPPNDLIIEGQETVILQVIGDTTNLCMGIPPGITLVINDPVPVNLNTFTDTIDCFTDSVYIAVSPSSGLPGFSYLWNNGVTDSAQWVSPTTSTDYTVTVTDTCGVSTATATLHVEVVPNSISPSLSPDPTVACQGDSATVWASLFGGLAPYEFWWSNGSTDSSQTVAPVVTTTYTVSMTDRCALDTVITSVTVYVQQYNQLQIATDPNQQAYCPGDPFVLHANASGGSGGYVYAWNSWSNTGDSIMVNPDVTTIYQAMVTDFCGTDTVSTYVTVFVPQYADMEMLTGPDLKICPDDPAELGVAVSGGTGIYTFAWSGVASGNDTVMVYPSGSESYTVTATDECGNAVSSEINVWIDIPEAGFDYLYGGGDNSVTFTNTSSDNAVIFDWQFGDGGSSNEENPVHTYPSEDVWPVVLYVYNDIGCSDSTSLIIKPPFHIWVPKAFTPDGDGLNDYFSVKASGLDQFEMSIFNRWGQMVFHSTDIENGWDGSYRDRKTPEDVYVYKIFATGKNFDQREIVGHVTLIR